MKYLRSVGYKKVTNLVLAFVLAVSSLTAALPFVFSGRAGAVASPYSQGFEGVTSDWTATSNVASGSGVTASTGVKYGQASSGAFTTWGGYRSAFPVGGYDTQLDIYLDTAVADGTDKRFDYSSAINGQDGLHQRDFIFNVGTAPGETGKWHVNANNNAPGNPSAPGYAEVTTSGWYTFKHQFRNVGGILSVGMTVLQKSTGVTVASFVRSNPQDVIETEVGGNRYGWFTSQRFDFANVAIDNALLTLVNAPQPTAPQNGGTTSNDTQSVTFSWTNVEGAESYEVRYSQNAGRIPNTNDGQLTTPIETFPTNVNSATKSNLPLGIVFWQARGVFGGVAGPWSNIWSTNIVDQTKPIAVNAGLSKYSLGANVASVKLTATVQDLASNVASFKYRVFKDNANGTETALTSKTISVPAADGAYDSKTESIEAQIATAGLSEGNYHVQLYFDDAKGNQGKRTLYFVVDHDDPYATAVALSDVLINSQDNSTTLKVDIADDATNVANLKYRVFKLNPDNTTTAVTDVIDGLSARDGAFDSRNESVDALIDTSSLADGNYRVQLYLYDAAGNQGKKSINFTVEKDLPEIRDLALSDTTITYNESNPLLTASLSDDVAIAGVEYRINDSAWVSVDAADGAYGGMNETISVLVDTVALDKSTYTLELRVFDQAGNVEYDSIQFTVDRTPPATNEGGESSGGEVEEGENATSGDGESLPGQDIPQPASAPVTPLTVTPIFTNPAAILGVSTGTGDNISGVEQDEDDSDVQGVSALNTPAQAADVDTTDGSLWGLAWYWWVLIAAGLALLIGWLVRMVRARANA